MPCQNMYAMWTAVPSGQCHGYYNFMSQANAAQAIRTPFGNSPAADQWSGTQTPWKLKSLHIADMHSELLEGLSRIRMSEEHLPGGGGSYEGGPMLLACICAEAAGGMVPARRECGLCIMPCLSGASG